MRAALRSTGFSQNTALPARGALDQVGMGIGRRADHDRVDVLRFDDRIDGADHGIARHRETLRRRRILVDHRRFARRCAAMLPP